MSNIPAECQLTMDMAIDAITVMHNLSDDPAHMTIATSHILAALAKDLTMTQRNTIKEMFMTSVNDKLMAYDADLAFQNAENNGKVN